MTWTFLREAEGSGNRGHSLKELVYNLENAVLLSGVMNTGPKFGAVLHSVGKVRRELLHFADAIVFPALDQHGVVHPHHLIAIAFGGLHVRSGREVLIDLAKDPRIIGCGAADHDGIATGFANHPDSVFGSDDIAVSDDRDLYRGFDLGDAAPVRLAAIALLA